LSDDEVAVLDLKAVTGKFPAVSDAIGLDVGQVYSSSGMEVKERERFRSFTHLLVKFGARDGDQVKVFSPFLSALKKEPRESSQFLDAISFYTKEPVPILTASSSAGELVASPLFASTQPFFVVEHPITIEWSVHDDKGELKPFSQCIRIASYSPFPVSLNEKFCVR
jgi:hypothetical protein